MKKKLLWLSTTLLLSNAGTLPAQTFKTILDFPNGPAPTKIIAGPKGSLYGITGAGNGYYGTVFELTSKGGGEPWKFDLLYAFTSRSRMGEGPLWLLAFGDTLFGTTAASAECQEGCGSIFQLSAPATIGANWSETTLYSFNGGTDGAAPGMIIAGPGGSFYGVTAQGGNPTVCQHFGQTGLNGCGTIFQLSPPVAAGEPWTKTTLYVFQGGTDSAYPSALALKPDGQLVGTTSGFQPPDYGSIFELTPPKGTGGVWSKETLYSFSGAADGSVPNGAIVVGGKGQIFGTTEGGGMGTGLGHGVTYELAPPASPGGIWTERVLHAFQGGTDGSEPFGLIAGGNGSLLGTTAGTEGTSDFTFLNGTVYRLSPPAQSGDEWSEQILYLFGNPAGPLFPTSLVAGQDGALYGTTTQVEDSVFQIIE